MSFRRQPKCAVLMATRYKCEAPDYRSQPTRFHDGRVSPAQLLPARRRRSILRLHLAQLVIPLGFPKLPRSKPHNSLPGAWPFGMSNPATMPATGLPPVAKKAAIPPSTPYLAAKLPTTAFRTEMSTPAYLTAWKSIVCGPSYVSSKCVGLIQLIFTCMLSGGPSEKAKIRAGSCDPVVPFR